MRHGDMIIHIHNFFMHDANSCYCVGKEWKNLSIPETEKYSRERKREDEGNEKYNRVSRKLQEFMSEEMTDILKENNSGRKDKPRHKFIISRQMSGVDICPNKSVQHGFVCESFC